MTPLERSIYHACCEIRPTESYSAHICTCLYHLHNPLSENDSSEESSGYPSLSRLLNEITPENCQRIENRKRSRNEEELEQLNDRYRSRLFHRDADQLEDSEQADSEIAKVMGFGSFNSTRNVYKDYVN